MRRPSPMDFVLDAPGLIENLVMCTAHDCSQVRSAAHEVLTTTAQEDTVATLAFRVLDLLETVGDWRGRVKAIEWINHLVAGRLKELAEAAVQANPSNSRRSAGGSAENALYALQGGDEDLALGRDSVDLAAGVEHAPGELAEASARCSRGTASSESRRVWTTGTPRRFASRRFSFFVSCGTPSPRTLRAAGAPARTMTT